MDSDELRGYFGGRAFSDLPFHDGYFATLVPFPYMAPGASVYYLGGYILDCLNRASRAAENPWAGMALPVVVTIKCLTVEMDFFRARFSVGQRECAVEFLKFVREHCDFFFYEDEVPQFDQAIAAYQMCA